MTSLGPLVKIKAVGRKEARGATLESSLFMSDCCLICLSTATRGEWARLTWSTDGSVFAVHSSCLKQRAVIVNPVIKPRANAQQKATFAIAHGDDATTTAKYCSG